MRVLFCVLFTAALCVSSLGRPIEESASVANDEVLSKENSSEERVEKHVEPSSQEAREQNEANFADVPDSVEHKGDEEKSITEIEVAEPEAAVNEDVENSPQNTPSLSTLTNSKDNGVADEDTDEEV